MAEHHVRPVTNAEVAPELAGRRAPGGGYWLAVIVLGVLALLGLIALIGKMAAGPEPRAQWGYVVGVLAFLFSSIQAAPVLAFMTRLAKGFWGVPLRRAAELGVVASLVTTPLYVIVLKQLPDWHGRRSIWFDWPGAPHLWDGVAVVTFAILGLALLYLTSLPDLAARRDVGRSSLARTLSLGWTGTTRQWQLLSGGMVVLGAFYLIMLVFMHLLIASDFAISLVPGWNSAVFAPYHAVTSLQAAIATTLLLAAAMRSFGGLERYIGLDAFWSAAKPMLALSLLFFYFTWSEFLIPWYGRRPEEQFLLETLMFGPRLPLFILAFLLCFILPFALLIWNRIRVSINGPTFVAALILVGNFIDRMRIYGASWSVAGPVGQHLEHPPDAVFPGGAEIMVIVGAIAAVGVLYLLALRIVPPISIWEFKNGLLLRVEVPYLRRDVAVVAKPR
jgi:molybdopterin-containing oxidoreductase family membrane subunit